MTKVYKPHPFMIWRFLKPYLFVLLLPILRAGLQYIRFKRIFDSLFWYELAFFILILVVAILKCFCFKVTCDGKNVTIKSGVLFTRRADIPISKLSSVQTLRNPFDMLFGAMTFRINTEAGEKTKADYEFKLKFKDAKELAVTLYGNDTVSKQRFSPIKVAIMAAATSSAFTGLIIGVPIIKCAGDLLGIALSDMLWSEINNVSSKIKSAFPPIVNVLTLIFLLGYGVSFVYSFFKFMKFRVIMGEKRVEVRSGFITKIRTAFDRLSVIDVRVEQSALMLFLNRFSMKVNIAGFGEKRSESQVMVPSGKYSELQKDFSFYFPFLEPSADRYYVAQRGALAVSRFLYWPTIYLLLTLGLSIPLALRFKDFDRFILFVTIALLVLIFYYAFVCAVQYKRCKFSLGDNIYASSKKWLRTCEIFCPKENVGQIKLTQVFTDFAYKTCKIRITVCSETADSLKLPHFDYKSTKEAILKCYGLDEAIEE